jgi:hypothetical protein
LSGTGHYGARYCPRFDIIKALVLAELHTLAQAPSLHDTAEGTAQAWHDALAYLLVLLSALTGGTRIGEIVDLLPSAVDLGFEPPLITLLGKGNRFTEESRTQCVLPRLLPLWQSISAGLKVSKPESTVALHVHTKRGQLRPMSRRDVWEHLRGIATRAGITANDADYAIRFHACRHFAISWLITHGSTFKDEGYWFGHQTAGNELLHPVGGGDVQQHWAEMTAQLHGLLDALGVTEAVVQAITHGDAEALCLLLPSLPKSLRRNDVVTNTDTCKQVSVEDTAQEVTDDEFTDDDQHDIGKQAISAAASFA